MKRILGSFALFFLFATFIQPVAAHITKNVPFLHINDGHPEQYPVFSPLSATMPIPQEGAPQPYIVGTPLTFQIERTLIPIQQIFQESMTFYWDFGDGQVGEGDEIVHTYRRIGSYILSITGKTNDGKKRMTHTVLLHIVPDKSYKLPQAVIATDSKIIADPLTDLLSLLPGETLTLSAAKSKQGSSPLKEYLWENEGITENKTAITVSHSPDKSYTFPILRVVDTQGFINDTYVQIQHQQPIRQKTFFVKQHFLPLLIGMNGILVVSMLVFLKWRKPS